jgi:hypothetical protein
MSAQAGASIQRAQTLFLKTLTPKWMQMEMCLNMSRVWRTQLANWSLQMDFHLLDTTQWVSSLNDIALVCSEDSPEEKRKRLKQALSEDANISPSRRSSFINELHINTVARRDSQFSPVQERDNLDGSIVRESDAYHGSQRKFTFSEDEMQLETSIHQVSSFASLAALLTTPNASRRQSRADSIGCGGSVASLAALLTTPNASRRQSRADSIGYGGSTTDKTALYGGILNEEKLLAQKPCAIDDVLDSVAEESFSGGEFQGHFLQKASIFIKERGFDFQHIDLWVPTSTEHNNMVNAAQVRLTNAGHVTIRSNKLPSYAAKRLNEFGVYSKNFAFSPGVGLPGRVFSSNKALWMNNLPRANPDEFARVGGSKVYGIRTAVGLPVSSSIGTMVVALYSTSDLTRDAKLEAECMNHFVRLQPIPKWRLCIDIASNETEDVIIPPTLGLSYIPRSSSAYIVPSSPVSEHSAQATSQLNEQSLALLLGKYESMDQGYDFDVSLRLLLLRHPSCRTVVETSHVGTILNNYRSYIRANRSERDIIRQITNDWKQLSMTNVHPVNISMYSSLTSGGFQVNGPNPDSFNPNKELHPDADCNGKTSGLEPRVVSDSKFQVHVSSPASSPASLNDFDCV